MGGVDLAAAKRSASAVIAALCFASAVTSVIAGTIGIEGPFITASVGLIVAGTSRVCCGLLGEILTIKIA